MNIVIGINTIFILREVEWDYLKTVMSFASYYGDYGLQAGDFRMIPLIKPPFPIIIQTLLTVVIHSYRHRYGLVPGDPSVEETEQHLTKQPKISVPSISLNGLNDGVAPIGNSTDHHHCFFTGKYEHRLIEGVGHNPPQEAPSKFIEAVLSLL